MWEKYGSWFYCFTLLSRIPLHWLFHVGFGEITFLKWGNVSNWNSWFLARFLNRFSRRFPFTQTNIYFLELKSILIQEKSIFHVSNLNIRELDSPTNLHQLDANCGKIWYVSEWVTPYQNSYSNRSATI